MYTLDKSLSFVEADESDVVEVYRSASPVTMAPEGRRNQPCEAYICAVKELDAIRYYVALWLTVHKKALVYSSAIEREEPADEDEARREAFHFAESMGFRMESVNLNYSPALREVIMRDLHVLRPPSAARRAAQREGAAKAEAERIAREKAEAKRIASEVAAQEWLALEKAAKKAAEEEAEAERIAAEKAEQERLAKEREAAEKAEAERLAAERAAAERAEAERVAAEKVEQERLAKEREAAEKAEAERLAAERAAAEKAEAERVAAEKAEQERLAAEKAAAEEAAAERLAAERAAAEMAEKERLALEQATALRTAVEKLAAEKEAAERLAGEKAMAAAIAAQKAAAAMAEEERAAAEKAEREWLASEKAEAERVAAEKAAAKAEEEKAEAERLAAQVAMEKAGEEGTAAAERMMDPFFAASRPSWSPTMFHPDRSLECIVFHAAEEVAELYQSMNMSRFAPEGYPTQNCGAYICVVKRDGLPRVYIAFLLTESEKVLVYAPDRQPENADACATAVQEAVFFVETVGFMMDAVELDADAEKRARFLSGIPVLCKTGGKA